MDLSQNLSKKSSESIGQVHKSRKHSLLKSKVFQGKADNPTSILTLFIGLNG